MQVLKVHQLRATAGECTTEQLDRRSLTLVAASTVASSFSSSATTSTWPSLEARWRAFRPFWEEKKDTIRRLVNRVNWAAEYVGRSFGSINYT